MLQLNLCAGRARRTVGPFAGSGAGLGFRDGALSRICVKVRTSPVRAVLADCGFVSGNGGPSGSGFVSGNARPGTVRWWLCFGKY